MLLNMLINYVVLEIECDYQANQHNRINYQPKFKIVVTFDAIVFACVGYQSLTGQTHYGYEQWCNYQKDNSSNDKHVGERGQNEPHDEGRDTYANAGYHVGRGSMFFRFVSPNHTLHVIG